MNLPDAIKNFENALLDLIQAAASSRSTEDVALGTLFYDVTCAVERLEGKGLVSLSRRRHLDQLLATFVKPLDLGDVKAVHSEDSEQT